MNIAIYSRAVAVGLLLASLLAAPTLAAEDCAELAKDGAGKAITLPAKPKKKDIDGLWAATLLALNGPSTGWPRDEIETPGACLIESFDIGSAAYQLSARSGGSAVYWATSADRADMIVLMLGPDLPSAYKWSRKPEGPATFKKPTYLLTMMKSGDPVLYVVGLYDEAPPRSQLKADMAKAFAKELPVLATYNRVTQRAEVLAGR